MTHWHVGKDGLHVYQAGKLVAVIPPDQFLNLLEAIARALRA